MTPVESIAARLAELERRLASLALPGTVCAIDKARVKVRYGDEAETGWIRWMASAAGETTAWRPPSMGEQVLLLSPGGDLGQARALPAEYSQAFPAPDSADSRDVRAYADGAVLRYDREAHELAALLPEGATLKIESPGGASLLGRLEVAGNVDVDGTLAATGDISADGNIAAKGDVSGANVSARGNVSDALGSMNEMRAVFNGHTHLVPGAPPTAVPAPVQQMT